MLVRQICICLFWSFLIGQIVNTEAEAAFWNKSTKKQSEKKEQIKSNRPHTVEEYQELSKEKKTEDIKIPDPQLPKNDKLINMPSPKFVLEKYNYPAGIRSTNLNGLKTNSQIFGRGVATQQGDKMAYVASYYNNTNTTVTSEIYIILNTQNKSIQEFLRTANVANKINTPIMSSGVGNTINSQQNILSIVDWAADGKKLAIKETIGERTKGIWQTNLWVYDIEAREAKELFELRNSIKSWWKNNKNIVLEDYMWDIKPLGWEAAKKDRLIAEAFIHSKGLPFFLGEWAINADGSFPEMLSEKKRTTKIEANGLILNFGPKY